MIDPLSSDAPLIVYLDFKSPYAYLAVEPMFSLEDELSINADWRPLTLDIPSYLGSARVNDSGKVVESRRSPAQWGQVKYAYRDAKRYARRRGVTMLGTQKIWDSSLASIGLQWAKRSGHDVFRDYVRCTYESFWKRELDIEDAAVVTAVLEKAGAATDGFAEYLSGMGRNEHDELQASLHPAGIFGVPTFVIEGQLFFGREHLPVIRWILEGRHGSAPDIAYEAVDSEGYENNGRGENLSPAADIEGSSENHPSLRVYVDFKSPETLLAIAPTLAMGAELGIEIDWMPLTAPRVVPTWFGPAAPANPQEESVGKRHRRARAAYQRANLERYAGMRGVELVLGDREVDSSLASIGLLWARRFGGRVAETYVARLATEFWSDALDIEDVSAVATLLLDCCAARADSRDSGLADAHLGIDPIESDDFEIPDFSDWAAREGRAEHDALQANLEGSYVLATPAYDIGGEIYIGRQHLPLVRQLLTRLL